MIILQEYRVSAWSLGELLKSIATTYYFLQLSHLKRTLNRVPAVTGIFEFMLKSAS